ncbi:MAG: thioredoxin domain-containing protein [Thermomicrobiales bacterium]
MRNRAAARKEARDTKSYRDLETRYRRSRLANIVLAVLVAFLGIVVIAQMQSGATTSNTGTASGTGATNEPFARRDPNDPMAMGSIDAPIVLSEWADLRCPFCAAFSRETLPVLIEEYVKPGKVRLEFNDVTFFGTQSEDAAVAARAAGEQGKYFDFLFAVFDAAPEGSHPDLPREKLIAFAVQAGVPDMERFTADLDRSDLRAAVQASTTRAHGAGINGVPFFLANGKVLSGAHPVDTFRTFLDEALAAAG